MKALKISMLVLGIIIVLGYLLPERISMPVKGATSADWNQDTFWYEPWGSSGVHKGIDIFGHQGVDVVSAVDGLVVFSGTIAKGGQVVVILGPKWRIHYYAHLDSRKTSMFEPVTSGETIGKLGDSGNAKGKPPHLHYSILRMIPAPWAMDSSTQGYKKAFYLDPGAFLLGQ
ncbi:M23 family metallopeptidase [Hahella ganghwensis]|uniref:M23 family metallopeptidase n=1 Tax=Hahella ganghwensis TaxID=286420 RepID=UPI00039EFEF9|nr:M23 family metallopeptidase [Hahella ganghwensis]